MGHETYQTGNVIVTFVLKWVILKQGFYNPKKHGVVDTSRDAEFSPTLEFYAG